MIIAALNFFVCLQGRSLSTELAPQRRTFRDPLPDQRPSLYFSKLPGSNMEFEECRELLAGMVASVLPAGSRILRTSVTQIMTDAESKLIYF